MNTLLSMSKSAALVSTAFFISACATPINSTIDIANEVDISKFETYAWISDEPYINVDATQSELVNPLNYRRIRAGIDAELRQKGYRQSPAGEADFVLGVTLGTRDRVRVQQYYSDYGYRYSGFYNRFNRFGHFGSSFGPLGTTTRVRTTTEGSVAIDVFDNKARQAIWHGHASKSLTGDATGQNLIAEAVDALIGPIPERRSVAVSVEGKSGADVIAM